MSVIMKISLSDSQFSDWWEAITLSFILNAVI